MPQYCTFKKIWGFLENCNYTQSKSTLIQFKTVVPCPVPTGPSKKSLAIPLSIEKL